MDRILPLELNHENAHIQPQENRIMSEQRHKVINWPAGPALRIYQHRKFVGYQASSIAPLQLISRDNAAELLRELRKAWAVI